MTCVANLPLCCKENKILNLITFIIKMKKCFILEILASVGNQKPEGPRQLPAGERL